MTTDELRSKIDKHTQKYADSGLWDYETCFRFTVKDFLVSMLMEMENMDERLLILEKNLGE